MILIPPHVTYLITELYSRCCKWPFKLYPRVPDISSTSFIFTVTIYKYEQILYSNAITWFFFLFGPQSGTFLQDTWDEQWHQCSLLLATKRSSNVTLYQPFWHLKKCKSLQKRGTCNVSKMPQLTHNYMSHWNYHLK